MPSRLAAGLALPSVGSSWMEGFRGPVELVRLLTNGQPILLVGRNSGTGSGAMAIAARDLHQAAAALGALGSPLPEFLPSEAEIVGKLKAAPTVVSHSREGRRFSHRFVELDLTRQCGVYVLVAVGSGKKLDADLRQPVTSRLKSIIRRIKPGLLYAKRLDRITRSAWTLGEAVVELNDCGGFIGDARRGEFRKCIGLEALFVFFDATLGEDDADKLPTQTRQGMRSGTSPRMEGEIARLGTGMFLPPGVCRIRLKSGVGQGEPLITFDRPRSFPDPAAVATGMPDVRDASGELVDQVENVRWVLANLGKPGMTADAIARQLPGRLYSTEGLRRRHGADAVWSYHPLSTMRALITNLEFYETGVLPVNFGVDGIDDMAVTNVFPADGPWATKQDFDRIRVYRAQVGRIAASRTKVVFTGLPCRVDGVDAVFVSALRNAERSKPRLALVKAESWPSTRESTGYNATVPAWEVAGAIVDAIAAAGDQALDLVAWDTDSEAALEANRKLAQLTADTATLEEKRRHLRRLLDAVDADGQLQSFGDLRREYVVEFNDTAEELAALAAKRTALEGELADIRRTEARTDGAAAAEELLNMVRSLSDCLDLTYRSVWLSALRDMELTTIEATRRQRTTRLTGALVIGSGDAAVRIPVDRTFTFVFRPDPVPARIDRAIDAMRGGTPLTEALPAPRCDLRRLVGERFGHTGSFLLSTCSDPRITRIAVAALLDWPDESDDEVAERVNEPVALVRRVRAVHTAKADGARWFLRGAVVMAELHARAAQRLDHTVTFEEMAPSVCTSKAVVRRTIRDEDGWTRWEQLGEAGVRLITPCPWCGSWRLAPMRIREVDGPLCLDCRRDSVGVSWPSEPYDQWLTAPHLWHQPQPARGGPTTPSNKRLQSRAG